MEKNKKNIKHSETETTIKLDANVRRYRCSLFCTRITGDDVLEPNTPSKKKDETNLPTITNK